MAKATDLFHSSIPTVHIAQAYSDLYKNDYGMRPRGHRSRRQMASWIENRPDRACGYQDPAEYAADQAWAAECDRREAEAHAAWIAAEEASQAEEAEAARFALWDYEVDAHGRVRFAA